MSTRFADLIQMWAQEVVDLQAKFQIPSPVAVHFQNDAKVISPCCKTSLACIVSSAQSCLSTNGVAGVLHMLENSIHWGFARKDYVCECLSHMNELDCEAGAALAVKVLRSVQFPGKENDLQFVPVQLIEACNASNITMTANQYKQLMPDSVVPWISGSYFYHVAVGIISTTTTTTTGARSIKIWDFGQWLQPYQVATEDSAIVSMRVVSSNSSSTALFYDWSGTKLIANEWTSTGDAWKTSTVVKEKEEDTSHPTVQHAFLPLPTAAIAVAINASEISQQHQMLTVYVSGCHMSANPCSGVGVARCLRSGLPVGTLSLVGLDVCTSDNLTGLTDGVFDRAVSYFDHTSLHKDSDSNDNNDSDSDSDSDTSSKKKNKSDYVSLDEQQWFDMLVRTTMGDGDEKRQGTSLFLPCTDNEVDLVARCMNQLPSSSSSSSCSRDDFSNRILSPTLSALSRIAKPTIPAAVEYFDMKVAPHLSIQEEEDNDDVTHHLSDATEKAYQFCNQHGYPILVKGKRQGAIVCYSWREVDAAINLRRMGGGGFLQRVVAGVDKGIAFSAVNGQLLGAVLCTKTISDTLRKLVSGELQALSPEVYVRLERFVRDTHWTGGGELEYVEDISGDCWAIDWNPRFPSWIFACTYSGCNLPALLVTAAAAIAAGSNHSDSSSGREGESSRAAAMSSLPVQSVSFTKTIVEIPRVNHHVHGMIPLLTLSGGLGIENIKGQGGGAGGGGGGGGGGVVGCRRRDATQQQSLSLSSDLQVLCSAVTASIMLMKMNISVSPMSMSMSMSTPRYLLSKELVWTAMDNQSIVLKDCAARAHTALHVHTVGSSSDGNGRSGFALQLCLSVKTQPHRAVLQMARQKGFFGECISLSEVRACLDAGFAPGEIVLTGPGKFWDATPLVPMPHCCTKNNPLHCIFTDSIADLKRIVSRLLDPQDWLNCEVVGVRFCPSWVSASRFGIDCRNPQCLFDAAKVLAALPPHIKLGAHFHHASSNLGVDSWFDLAHAFLSITEAFAALCVGRCLAVVDFGGGWTNDFLSIEENQKRMTELFGQVILAVPRIISSSSSSSPSSSNKSVVTVQFEMGKSITERAGAILCRVLEIREMMTSSSSSSLSEEGLYCDDLINDKDKDSDKNSDSDKTSRKDSDSENVSRGVILDCTIGDISACATYPHPLLWFNPRSTAWEHIQTAAAGRERGGGRRRAVVLGRSCMEFDSFFHVSLPEEMIVGDLVMVCSSGAYDTSMQYNFGDGVGREQLEVL